MVLKLVFRTCWLVNEPNTNLVQLETSNHVPKKHVKLDFPVGKLKAAEDRHMIMHLVMCDYSIMHILQCTPYVMLITRVNICVFSLICLLMCLLLWWTVGKNRSCAVSINRTSNGSLKHILQQFDGLILWQSFWQRIPHSSLFTQPPSSYHSYHRSHSTQLSLSLFLSLVSCHTNLLCMLNSKLTASFMLWTLNPDISFPF